jgi:uncharacterized protein (DUF885 family)
MNSKTILASLLIVFASGSVAQPTQIDDFFTEFTAEWVRANPNQAVSTGYFTGEEQNLLEQQLTPLTLERQLEVEQRARQGLEQLSQLDFSGATETQRIAGEVMKWQLENLLEGGPWRDASFSLNQHTGANVSLPNQLTVTHPIRTAADAENYLLRLRQVDERMNEATAEAARRSLAGYRPPAFILRSTIEQMDRFIAPPAAENPLTTTLLQKTTAIDLPEAQRNRLIQQAAEIVQTEVYPAWQAAADELRAQLLLANDDAGLWRFENGEEIYAYNLKSFTSTDLGAEQIHQIGLEQVARISAQMDTLLRQVGLAEGSVEQRVEILRGRLSYPDTDEGHAQIMADIDVFLADALVRSAEYFDNTPKASVIAQPYPRFRWANAAASYTSPPQDGSRPGVFQMPLRPSRLTKFSLRSLVYHETVPGHHFQIALFNEDQNQPRFMQIRAFGGISATTEGWALYAERLAAESGWYNDDPEGLLGQLNSELFRAKRLVVDTGLHAKGWTRQQAIDYGIEASEIDRYVVNPGQATSYMIGQLKFIELRERARAAFGDDFSISEFHNVVLSLGVVPLTVLEREVDKYINDN